MNVADLDGCTKEHYLGDELRLLTGTKAKILKSVLNRDFETLQLEDYFMRLVKIGSGLPIEVKEGLIRCLSANTYLSTIPPHEMSVMDLRTVCYPLNIDPGARYVSKRQRWQSPKKAEATVKTVQGLLNANFISEVKYIEWLSNIELVKKA